MDIEKLVEQSLRMSRSVDAIATDLFQNAKRFRREGRITYEEYREVMNNFYLPLMSHASKILLDASIKIITNMDQYMNQLEASIENLKKASDRVEKVEDTFTAITYVLGVAAAVASFVAAPSPATFMAATSVLSGAIESISVLVS